MALRVRTEFTGVGVVGPSVNTLIVNGANATNAQQAVEWVADFWSDVATSVCGGQLGITIDPAVDQFGTTDGIITAVHQTNPPSVSSGVAGAILNPASQALLSLRTGHYVNGRELRGKIFIPSLLKTAADTNGALSASARSSIEDAFDTMQTAASNQVLVWSRTHLTSHYVTGWQANSKIAVLRSRRD